MSEFDAVKQMEVVLSKWSPDSHVDVRGIIIDYLHRSGRSLFTVLKKNYDIYDAIFVHGSVEDQSNLLRSIIHSREECQELFDQCQSAFWIVATRLTELYGTPANSVEHDPVALCSGPSKAGILWQISDIHFGKFNVGFSDPMELASVFGHLIGLYPFAKPDYILISGDVSSTASEDEFRMFKEFCSRLSVEIWEGHFPQRVIVVPGNHDTLWTDDGQSDRLAHFCKHLGNKDCCIIPFGDPVDSFKNPNVEVTRFRGSSLTSPPFAVAKLSEINLEVVMLVSSYYSGEVPKELRALILDEVKDEDLKAHIIEHVRKDCGEVSVEYLSLISRMLNATTTPRIGLIHHHLVQYGAECCLSKQGFSLLKTLGGKGVPVVLHGHLHMFEDGEETRAHLPGLAFCIPCSTISSTTWRRSPGFSIHVLRKESDVEMTSLTWELSESGLFDDKQLLVPSYKAQLTGHNTGARRIMRGYS